MNFKSFLVGALLLGLTDAGADGLSSLEAFVKATSSGRADFTQVVTSPSTNGQPARARTSTGQFEFVRPSRFRFDYAKPFAQSIVADGQKLWLFDKDLNQVTVRRQAAVLGSTPAALIAAAPDLQSLKVDFDLSSMPEHDGLQWMQATPKSRDGQLQSVRAGFRVRPGDPTRMSVTLEVLEILDSFGQRSVLTFHSFESNPELAPGDFRFKAPVGADVIEQ